MLVKSEFRDCCCGLEGAEVAPSLICHFCVALGQVSHPMLDAVCFFPPGELPDFMDSITTELHLRPRVHLEVKVAEAQIPRVH